MEKLITRLNELFQTAFEDAGYDRSYGSVFASSRADLCQFQCNGALPAAKVYKKAPQKIAQEIIEKIIDPLIFKDVTSAGPGFININLKDTYLHGYIKEMSEDEKYGVITPLHPMNIVVDYGGANVAKPLHVGHLRAAIIGESIKRISRYLGHNVIGDVHLGDWGLQIGMVISELQRRLPTLPYFKENYSEDYPTEPPFSIDELEEIYPAASKLAKSDEAAMEEARRITYELQNGRKGYIALWKHILKVSVEDLKKNYGNLNVEFDLWKGESDCQQYIDEMVNYLKLNNFTYESQGAIVIDVAEETDNYTIPPFILLKSDGATLYSTTDLATICQRVKDYDPDEIVYVVDKRQGLHFEQVFRCAKRTKLVKDSLEFDFIGFGTMNGTDGKPFKTRDGGVMRLQDLIEIVRNSVKTKLHENPLLTPEETEDIAQKVGLSALKYGDLSNQATKDYIFDLDKFSSFEGNTGPYILYTVVRIKSILRKASVDFKNIEEPKEHNFSVNITERNLMLQLTKFNEVVELSFLDKAPHKICEYVYELSNLFNRFYHENRILSEEDVNKRNNWLNLITLTMNVLEKGLWLLGIEAPEKM